MQTDDTRGFPPAAADEAALPRRGRRREAAPSLPSPAEPARSPRRAAHTPASRAQRPGTRFLGRGEVPTPGRLSPASRGGPGHRAPLRDDARPPRGGRGRDRDRDLPPHPAPPHLTSPPAAAAALSGGAAAPSPGGAAAAAPARPPSLRRRRPPPQPHHPAGSGGRQPLADGGRGGDGAGAASGRGRRRRAPACRCPPVFAALWPAALQGQAVGGRRLPACYREPRRRGLGALERLLPTGASPVGFGFRGLRARLHPGVPSLTSPRPPGCRPYDTRMAPWPASARDRWKGRSEMSSRVVGTHPSCVRNSRRWLAAYFLEGVRKIIHNPHRDQLKGEAGVSCFSN